MCQQNSETRHYSSNGIYTVKSGYHLATQLRKSINKDNPGTSFQPSAKLWKAIWSLNVPKKISIFWWRVCKNGLATKENLFRRRCAPSDICPICNSEVESIEHLLFFCSWARTVWFGCKIMFNGPCGSPNSAIQWTAKIYQALHKKEATAMVSKVAFIAWNVWKSRNNFVFRNYD